MLMPFIITVVVGLVTVFVTHGACEKISPRTCRTPLGWFYKGIISSMISCLVTGGAIFPGLSSLKSGVLTLIAGNYVAYIVGFSICIILTQRSQPAPVPNQIKSMEPSSNEIGIDRAPVETTFPLYPGIPKERRTLP